LEKNTPSDHLDYEDIKKAVLLVEEIVAHINDAKRIKACIAPNSIF
jgi:hypothetical protein